MIDFLRDLLSRPGAARTVILLEPDAMGTPRQYEVRPSLTLYAGIIGVVVGAALLIAVAVMTPLRGLLFGADSATLRTIAEQNARRAEALEDSVTFQYQQIAQLRAIITGEMDALGEDALSPEAFSLPDPDSAASGPAGGSSGSGTPPRPPVADPPRTLRTPSDPAARAAAAAYLSGLRVPALPPIEGVLSRGFNAARGHFGIDIAANEGTPVRCFGDGYVVLADWTHAGGYTVAVQHLDGYLSVYKHNSRLLKRVGERVLAREAIALSGDTGVVTSGPHLHFELWRDGLARDPASSLLL